MLQQLPCDRIFKYSRSQLSPVPQNLSQYGDKLGGHQILPGAEGQGQVDHQRHDFSGQSTHAATNKPTQTCQSSTLSPTSQITMVSSYDLLCGAP